MADDMLFTLTAMNVHFDSLELYVTETAKVSIRCKQCQCIIFDFSSPNVTAREVLSVIKAHVMHGAGVPSR